MNIFTLLLFLVLPASATICRTEIQIPHASVIIPFSAPTTIPLPVHLSHPCKLLPSTPLIVLVPGGLTRPTDYSLFTRLLSKSGFITALPDYTSRPITSFPVPQLQNIIQHVNTTIENGLDCPRNTQAITTAVIQSVLSWFSGRTSVISKAADLNNVLLFGHSQGGAAVNFFLSNGCIPFSQPVNATLPEILSDERRVAELFPRLLCEQYKPSVLPGVRVAGVLTYEGISSANFTVPRDTFHVAMHTSFAPEFRNLSERIDGEGRVVRVLLRDANHFGVNDFFEGNQTPPCALPRPPPEDAFSTCRKVQKEVVVSVTGIVTAVFQGFVRGRIVRVAVPKVGEIELVK